MHPKRSSAAAPLTWSTMARLCPFIGGLGWGTAGGAAVANGTSVSSMTVLLPCSGLKVQRCTRIPRTCRVCPNNASNTVPEWAGTASVDHQWCRQTFTASQPTPAGTTNASTSACQALRTSKHHCLQRMCKRHSHESAGALHGQLLGLAEPPIVWYMHCAMQAAAAQTAQAHALLSTNQDVSETAGPVPIPCRAIVAATL